MRDLSGREIEFVSGGLSKSDDIVVPGRIPRPIPTTMPELRASRLDLYPKYELNDDLDQLEGEAVKREVGLLDLLAPPLYSNQKFNDNNKRADDTQGGPNAFSREGKEPFLMKVHGIDIFGRSDDIVVIAYRSTIAGDNSIWIDSNGDTVPDFRFILVDGVIWASADGSDRFQYQINQRWLRSELGFWREWFGN